MRLWSFFAVSVLMVTIDGRVDPLDNFDELNTGILAGDGDAVGRVLFE